MSQEYYLRLEQGKDRRPSEQVLRALARALLLDESATEHLLNLARSFDFDPVTAGLAVETDFLNEVLGTWSGTPAYIVDSRQTVLLANAMAQQVASGPFTVGVNIVEAVFTDDIIRASPTWEALATRMVKRLRFFGNPYDPGLHELADRLSAVDPLFRTLWERHDADPGYNGTVNPPVQGFGPVPLRYQTLLIPGTPGYLLCVLVAEPGSRSAEVMEYLASRIADVHP